jgi:hypothetical protein
MSAPILYLGDTSLQSAAAYLAGLMHAWGWSFDYLPSDQPAGPAVAAAPRALFVVSDYPAVRMGAESQRRLLEHVQGGAGLLMLGGWESYHGCGGNWDGTPLASALPVEISPRDDRVNCDQPTLLEAIGEHPVTRDLPWQSRPPAIGGLNRLRPRAEATLLLQAQHFAVRREASGFCFEPSGSDPALVVGRFGDGRTAALATDVAPHWVGGLVDWGPGRVAAAAPGAEAIEVGDLYARFFRQLLAWTGRLERPSEGDSDAP